LTFGKDATVWYAVPLCCFHGETGRSLAEFVRVKPSASDCMPKKKATQGYDAARMTPGHDHWKDGVIQKCLDLEEKAFMPSQVSDAGGAGPAPSSWVYFDAFCKDGERLRVTDALIRRGRRVNELYCANPDEAIFSELRAAGVNAECCRIEDVLATSRWDGACFSVAYLDTCSSDPHFIFEIVMSLLKKTMLRQNAIVVTTMTSRGDDSLSDRMEELEKRLSVWNLEKVDVKPLAEKHHPVATQFFRMMRPVEDSAL